MNRKEAKKEGFNPHYQKIVWIALLVFMFNWGLYGYFYYHNLRISLHLMLIVQMLWMGIGMAAYARDWIEVGTHSLWMYVLNVVEPDIQGMHELSDFDKARNEVSINSAHNRLTVLEEKLKEMEKTFPKF